MAVVIASDRRETALEHACRSAVGDRLRAVSVCSDGDARVVYRRSDLSRDADASVHEEAAAAGGVVADGGRAVGEFDHGYVTHARVGDTDVVVTTDGLKMDRETEISAVVRGVLSD